MRASFDTAVTTGDTVAAETNVAVATVAAAVVATAVGADAVATVAVAAVADCSCEVELFVNLVELPVKF